MVELGAEPLLDLRTNLRAQAQVEPSGTEQLVVVGLMREVNRVARKRNRHIGHQIQATHRGGQGQRREHVVWAFEGGHATGPGVAQLARPFGRSAGRTKR